jgi:putative SOS response-associated peptidase YedK
MINARAETVATKPAFRRAFRERRCLILADGFYQWQRQDRRKQPFCIRLGVGRPFAFAGLWDDGPSDEMRNVMTWP